MNVELVKGIVKIGSNIVISAGVEKIVKTGLEQIIPKTFDAMTTYEKIALTAGSFGITMAASSIVTRETDELIDMAFDLPNKIQKAKELVAIEDDEISDDSDNTFSSDYTEIN